LEVLGESREQSANSLGVVADRDDDGDIIE
jgi:hypothetical protein